MLPYSLGLYKTMIPLPFTNVNPSYLHKLIITRPFQLYYCNSLPNFHCCKILPFQDLFVKFMFATLTLFISRPCRVPPSSLITLHFILTISIPFYFFFFSYNSNAKLININCTMTVTLIPQPCKPPFFQVFIKYTLKLFFTVKGEM